MSKGNLKEILQFPIVGYEKLNGFLGLVSYNHLTNDFYICTKSNCVGEYANYFKYLFYKTFNADKRSFLLNYLIEKDCTLAFEVIDIQNDPHIIRYGESEIVLLSIISNDIYFKESSYDEVLKLAEILNINYTKRLITLNNFEELISYYNNVILEEDIFDITGYHIEGLVFKDVNNFMFKVKFPYYNYWKYMRGLLNKYFLYLKSEKNVELENFLCNLTDLDKHILLFIVNLHLEKNMEQVDILSYLEDKRLLNYLSSLSNNILS